MIFHSGHICTHPTSIFDPISFSIFSFSLKILMEMLRKVIFCITFASMQIFFKTKNLKFGKTCRKNELLVSINKVCFFKLWNVLNPTVIERKNCFIEKNFDRNKSMPAKIQIFAIIIQEKKNYFEICVCSLFFQKIISLFYDLVTFFIAFPPEKFKYLERKNNLQINL